MQFGYCGNVHPGRTLDEVKTNLAEHAVKVKQSVFGDQVLPIGLWLSATTANELTSDAAKESFRDWLDDKGLLPFTFNGFPFGDFHQEVVKHSVYEPTWADASRLDYTCRLADIQHALLPSGIDGSISTLPLGWPHEHLIASDNFLIQCAENLRQCAQYLQDLFQETGRTIAICIEPEPGCFLDRSEDVVRFFSNRLMTGNAAIDAVTLNHVRVCHDICHSAVMFEDQRKAIENYADAGISIGKVQVSSAISVDFAGMLNDEKSPILRQLEMFSEPRYLHQTSVHTNRELRFYQDLPDAMMDSERGPQGEWRVHFHVPIFAEALGSIHTTQDEIGNCLEALSDLQMAPDHFEIETYAWNVLPEEFQTGELSEGIASELEWFRSQYSAGQTN